MYDLHKSGSHSFKWLNEVKNILYNVRLNFIWDQQTADTDSLKNIVKDLLTSQFYQSWSSEILSMSKCCNYKIFKDNFALEKYLTILPDKLRIPLTKFRCRNHKLPIVNGIFLSINKSERFCKMCNSGVVGDEYHYIFICPYFDSYHNKFIPEYFIKRPSHNTFFELFNSNKPEVLTKLAKFAKIILNVLTKNCNLV